MIRKNVWILMGLVFTTWLTGCKSGQVITGVYQDVPLLIDGHSNDWKESLHYDKSSKVWYAVSNDDATLYICLKVEDEAVQRKIRMFGMTVWIDTTGGTKKMLGIHFPLKEERMHQEGGMRQKDMVQQNQDEMMETQQIQEGPFAMKKALFPSGKEVELIGFRGMDHEQTWDISKSPVKVSVGSEEKKMLIYEASIPLTMLFGSTNFNKSRLVSAGIITGCFSTPSGSGSRPSGGMGPGGMGPGGFPPGGSMAPPGGFHSEGGEEMKRNSSGNNGMNGLSKPTKCWIKHYSIIKK